MYAAIDMKSFYASVECVERNLDPLNTNLVVADITRSENTICLAVSPALKAFGIPGRPRLFEVVRKVDEINEERLKKAPYHEFIDKSFLRSDILKNDSFMLDYIVAPPRMALYEDYSARIYSVFLKYFSAEDIHVYSCDEAFIYIEPYLRTYNKSPHDLVMTVIRDVLEETGITATAGIGTNMYLCKVAMDIVSKKMPADKDGVRIAELNELSYREQLWEHTPLTDFWEIAKGTESRLHNIGLYNMGDICLQSLKDSEVLYKQFGINAEMIIDHAWGWETTTIRDIKNYKPKTRSISTSQVLMRPYTYEEALIVLQEMVESLVLRLVESNCAAKGVSLGISYDCANVYIAYCGQWAKDTYGRNMPKPVSGTRRIKATSSLSVLNAEFMRLFSEKVDKMLNIRKISIALNDVISENDIEQEYIQYDMFTDVETIERKRIESERRLEKEKAIQKAMIGIKGKYGKNAVLRAYSFLEASTARDRNNQIGGHRA